MADDREEEPMTAAVTTKKTVTLDGSVMARLVAGHVHNLFGQYLDALGDQGCCNICCPGCSALKDLYDAGLLDVIYARYMEDCAVPEFAVWDSARDQIGRDWLNKAWSVDMGCGDGHLDMVK